MQVSELGLGCSGLGGGVFQRDDAAALRLLDGAFERGVRFFDLADIYGYGHCERLVGRAMHGRRDQVVLASKGGNLLSSLAGRARPFLPLLQAGRRLLQPLRTTLKRASLRRQDFSPRHLQQALEGTLQRLATDHVDLYQLHSPPRELLERGEVFEWLDRMKRAGKIRAHGVSVRAVADAVYCARRGCVDSVQVPFNLLEPEASQELLPLAAATRLGVIARVPFARGLLTAQAKVRTGLGPEGSGSDGLARRAGLVAGDHRADSLRFILGFDAVSTVIPGTTSLEHLEQNIAALSSRRGESPA